MVDAREPEPSLHHVTSGFRVETDVAKVGWPALLVFGRVGLLGPAFDSSARSRGLTIGAGKGIAEVRSTPLFFYVYSDCIIWRTVRHDDTVGISWRSSAEARERRRSVFRSASRYKTSGRERRLSAPPPCEFEGFRSDGPAKPWHCGIPVRIIEWGNSRRKTPASCRRYEGGRLDASMEDEARHA